jgi:hypothetical protein
VGGRVLRSSWLPIAVVGVVWFAVLNREIDLLDVVRWVAYVLSVAVPGVFCWRLLLRHLHVAEGARPTWLEDLSLGTIFGFGLQLPFFLLGVAVGRPLLVLALPVIVLAMSVSAFGRRVWTLPTARADPAVAWSLATVIGYGLFWLVSKRFAHRPLSLEPHEVPAVDETFHLALISDIANRFPPQIPFLLDTRLDYHWFVHAQVATARTVTGIDAVVLLQQLMPTLVLVLAILGLASVAQRLTGRPLAAAVAPALLIVGAFHLNGPHYSVSSFTEPYLMNRFVTSPSQSYGVMMSMPAVMLLLEVLRPQRRVPRLTWLVLAATLLALAGSKATFLPIFTAAAVALWLIELARQRRIDRTVTAVVALLIAATVFAQLVIFGGRTGSLAVSPLETADAALLSQEIEPTAYGAVVVTLAMLTGWLLYGAGAVGLVRSGRWRDPRAVWLLVAIAAGMTVAFVFYRSGQSQLWFARSVAELVALLSAWGLSLLLPDPLPRRRALQMLGVAAMAGLAAFAVSSWVETTKPVAELATHGTLLATVLTPLVVVLVFMVVRRLVGGSRRPPGVVLLAVLLGLALSNVCAVVADAITDYPRPPATSSMFREGGVEAARVIERRSTPDAIVATNAHCKDPGRRQCDNRHFWISAYTERRIVIEGWGYTAPTNANYERGVRNAFIPAPYPERLEINNAAFRQPSAETVGRLADTYGVRWLFVDKAHHVRMQRLKALPDVVKPVFEDANYAVFKVLGSSG